MALIIKLPSMEDLNRYKAKNVMDYYDKSVSQSVNRQSVTRSLG